MAEGDVSLSICLAAMRLAGTQRRATVAPLRVPVVWLSLFLMYRAGLSSKRIADGMGFDVVTVRKAIVCIMALMRFPDVRAHVEGLARDMPRIMHDAPATLLRFPGPSVLRSVEVVAV